VEDLGVDIAYQSVLNSDVQPLSRIAVSASQRDIAVWLHGLVKQAQLQGTCYLKVWDFGFAPWVEVRVNDSGEWLTSLWSHLKNHAFLIVNRERRILLIIDEEEYWYEAYLRELPHQI